MSLSKCSMVVLSVAIQLFCFKIVYINTESGCYYVSDRSESWFDALTICQMLGRCLASISTQKMHARLAKHLKANCSLGHVEFWTGANAYEKLVFGYVEDSTHLRFLPKDAQLDPEDSCVYVQSRKKKNLLMKSDVCCTKRRFICADTTVCNARKMTLQHSLALGKENENADCICDSLANKKGCQNIKGRTGNNLTIDAQHKEKFKSTWKKFLQNFRNV